MGPVRSKDVRSAADGYFRLSALAVPEGTADEWELVARAWTGTSLRTLGTLAGIEPNGDDVELVVERIEEATATLVGRIEADTSPIPGDVQARLVDEGRRGGGPLPFDPDTGAFTKGPLRPGTYRIELSRGGMTVGTKSGLVVAADETLDAGVIRVGSGGSVEVWPVQPAGARVTADELRAATATLLGPGQQQVSLEWSDGAWRSHGLLEPGAWHLSLLVEGAILTGRDITIRSGEVTRTEIAVSRD